MTALYVPEEIVSHIICSVSPDDTKSLAVLSTVSRAFHRMTYQHLYRAVTLTGRERYCHKRRKSLCATAYSFELRLRIDPALGQAIRELKLSDIDSTWGRYGDKIIEELVQGVKDSLEKLILSNITITELADVLAIPPRLHHLIMDECCVGQPASSQPIVLTNSIRKLELEYTFLYATTLPATSCPYLSYCYFSEFKFEYEDTLANIQEMGEFLSSVKHSLHYLGVDSQSLLHFLRHYPTIFHSWSEPVLELTQLWITGEDLETLASIVNSGGVLNLGTLIAAGPSLRSLVLSEAYGDEPMWAEKVADLLRTSSFRGLIFPRLSKLDIVLEIPRNMTFAGVDSIAGISGLRATCEERGIELVFVSWLRD